MSAWTPTRLDWVCRSVRDVVDPAQYAGKRVFLYSIPMLDAIGDGVEEDGDGLGSSKLRLVGTEVLISKLNPRKARIVEATPHDIPTLASTEFVVLEPWRVHRRFLSYVLQSEQVRQQLAAATQSVTRSQQRVDPDLITKMWISLPESAMQRAIADYLDRKTAPIDALIANQSRLISLLNERIDALIMEQIGVSNLEDRGSAGAVPLKRLLRKVVRPVEPGSPVVTAYRNGEVTARASRRAEGYTLAADESTYQGVKRGDVVVHGLDGFSGAIGTCRVDGCCSPVYHVCEAIGGNHATHLARMLRILALDGYIGAYATSVRERAVDLRNWDLLGSIPVPLVAPEEQTAAVRLIDEAEPITHAATRISSLLHERRQALITGAVIGDIEIPVVAA